MCHHSWQVLQFYLSTAKRFPPAQVKCTEIPTTQHQKLIKDISIVFDIISYFLHYYIMHIFTYKIYFLYFVLVSTFREKDFWAARWQLSLVKENISTYQGSKWWILANGENVDETKQWDKTRRRATWENPGHVYVPCESFHLTVDSRGLRVSAGKVAHIDCDEGEKGDNSRWRNVQWEKWTHTCVT